MKKNVFIQKVTNEGRITLTEAESKKLLSRYGIPVVEEFIVHSENSASNQAKEIGFPVVLKGLGANLSHKTERGLVKLDLRSDDQVRSAFQHIKKSAGTDWEGCLVQPLIEGKREFAAGLYRDPQFGPVVMFGVGGVFTEAIQDVAFRIAPLSPEDAAGMMDELSSHKLLSAFRGEAAADREVLINTLIGLSELGLAYPDVMEVDINPLIIQPDGRVLAVDALIILKKGPDDLSYTSVGYSEEKNQDLEHDDNIRKVIHTMAHPGSIAVMGAKRSRGNDISDLGDIFHRVSNFGYPGRLYPINPNVKDIRGHKTYPDLASLPEIPDLVIICLQAKLVPDALRSCVVGNCKNIHIFSSGFKETGEEAGITLQTEIEQIARDGGLHVIGPNCMGLHVPSSNITTMPYPPKESGPVAFVSQSGGNARDFNRYLHARFGLGTSKIFSYGNALNMDCTDFLAYLATDDQTRVIAMYLEGVKDGRKLLRIIRNIVPVKPVIMFKAGLTDSGARAVASHTGSMAGNQKIWDAFFKQSGAIAVDSMEQLAETATALYYLEKTKGRNVAIVGTGGGMSVAVSDTCTKAGLNLPAFSDELAQKLYEFVPRSGNMVCNPIDAHFMFFNLEILGRTLNLLSRNSGADMFIISLQLDWIFTASGLQAQYLETIARYIADEGRKNIHGKPLVVAFRQYEDNPEVLRHVVMMRDIFLKAGIPFYEGLSTAVLMLSKLAGYSEFCKGFKSR
jgi:acyl-CoA synthetase (NDP forming)